MDSVKSCCAFSKIRFKSFQIFIVAGTVLLALLITVLCIGFLMRYEVEGEVSDVDDYWNDFVDQHQRAWYNKGIKELRTALKLAGSGNGRPRNVLVFLVNGVDIELLAAARFHRGNGSTPTAMLWDKFPHVAHLKNSCSRVDFCDPGTVATSLFGGVRANFKTAGVDTSVEFRNCSASLNATHHVASVVRQAQLSGLRTGFVTTQRLTGPTGAALYAHVPDTSWECDATMPKGMIAAGCKDVARQLIEDVTGSGMNVLLGGGRQALNERVASPSWDPLDESVCRASDDRNLLREWQQAKTSSRRRYELVQQREELTAINGSRLDYLMGVFANGDLSAVGERAPNMALMLDRALNVLVRPKKGYLLVAEQYINARLNTSQQLDELLKFNEAVTSTLKHKKFSTSDTLVLLAFTKGNYMSRGLDTSDETDLVTNFYDIIENDLLLSQHVSDLVGDTLVLASGPKSGMFHGIHEETYLAHTIAFALQMGPFRRP